MAPAKSGTGQHIVGPLSGGGGRLIGHVHKSSSSMSRSCRVDVCLQLHPLRFTTDMEKTDLSAAYLFETSYREHKVDIWNPMKSYEIPWKPMKSYEIIYEIIYEIPWNPMRFLDGNGHSGCSPRSSPCGTDQQGAQISQATLAVFERQKKRLPTPGSWQRSSDIPSLPGQPWDRSG
jgi:hypothetical protein